MAFLLEFFLDVALTYLGILMRNVIDEIKRCRMTKVKKSLGINKKASK